MSRGFRILRLVTLLAGVLAATCPASGALLSLGGQVNDDPANMIDPSQDAGLVDAAGGTVVAGVKRKLHDSGVLMTRRRTKRSG